MNIYLRLNTKKGQRTTMKLSDTPLDGFVRLNAESLERFMLSHNMSPCWTKVRIEVVNGTSVFFNDILVSDMPSETNGGGWCSSNVGLLWSTRMGYLRYLAVDLLKEHKTLCATA